MEIIDQNSEQYEYAKNRVKKLKGFYVHLSVYILINILIISGTFYDRPFTIDTFFSFETFSTAIFWGIGLIAHAASVFGKDLLFNKKWEEKKIQEFMKNEEKTKWE
jgi:H+/gluconate symporter-like permease